MLQKAVTLRPDRVNAPIAVYTIRILPRQTTFLTARDAAARTEKRWFHSTLRIPYALSLYPTRGFVARSVHAPRPPSGRCASPPGPPGSPPGSLGPRARAAHGLSSDGGMKTPTFALSKRSSVITRTWDMGYSRHAYTWLSLGVRCEMLVVSTKCDTQGATSPHSATRTPPS